MAGAGVNGLTDEVGSEPQELKADQQSPDTGDAKPRTKRRRRRRPKNKAHGSSQNQAQAETPKEGGDRRRPKQTQQNSRRKQRNGQRHHNHSSQRLRDRPAYAALDLGTNNCRLLVAVPDGQSFRVVDAFSRIVRLGEGIAHSNRISDDAMNRALDALAVCASKLKSRGIKNHRLIATEACRIAENGSDFLSRVLERTGLELEIVNRETEARLAVTGCASLVDKKSDGVILFDIGGGSSELVWLDMSARKFKNSQIAEGIRSWTSLPVGVVNLSERHGGVEVTPESFDGMVQEVRKMLADFPEADALSDAVKNKHIHMLGTSGTVTTLAGVHLDLTHYDRRKVDGIWMSAEDVTSMTSKLLSMSFNDRQSNACIGKERADLVLAGCAILEAMRQEWPCDWLRVADRGLREGILYELMYADRALLLPGKRRRRPRKRKPADQKNTVSANGQMPS